MTLMDYTIDAPEAKPSVEVKRSSLGYRVREMKLEGWHVLASRIITSSVCLGFMAAGAWVWTLADSNFAGNALLMKGLLSVALYVVAAAMVWNGAFSRRADEVQVDMKGRVLHVITGGAFGMIANRKTLRFEEITRIDLDSSNLMTEFRSVWTRWDYGRVILCAHGDQRVTLFAGDMADLEPLLRRLRADTGVV